MSRQPRGKGAGSLFLIIVLVFSAFGLAAGAPGVVYKRVRPLKKKFEVQKETTKKKVLAATKKNVDYIYDPSGKTDPFKSFIAIQEEMKEKKRRRPRTYLETIDLSQLELSVIVTSRKGNLAMVRDSKGLGHVIKKGTLIGTNGGVVYEITKNEVVIREEYRDFRGRKRHKDIKKNLPAMQ